MTKTAESGGALDWDVFLQQGRPMLLARQITKQTLFTVQDSGLADPVPMAGHLDFRKMLPWFAAWTLAPYGITILMVLGFSALINRFKLRVRMIGTARIEYASLFRRFLAHFIDTVLTLLPFAVAGGLFYHYYASAAENPFLIVLIVMITVLFYLIAGYLYHSLFEGLYGATPGKRLCGIQVLKADLSACGLGPAFLRNLLRIVDGFFYYLVAVIALAGALHWQRLGDLVAETIVVRRPRSGAPAGPPAAS